VGSAAASIGFLQTTLEPHLHDLKVNGETLTSFQVSGVTNPFVQVSDSMSARYLLGVLISWKTKEYSDIRRKDNMSPS
jgi:hypothetical protein